MTLALNKKLNQSIAANYSLYVIRNKTQTAFSYIMTSIRKEALSYGDHGLERFILKNDSLELHINSYGVTIEKIIMTDR